MRKKTVRWIGKHKVWLIAAAVVLAIVFILFGTKMWLFVNFLLGNDIIVSLDTDAAAITLQRGETVDVTFTAGVTTNPFCSVACSSVFKDLSFGGLQEDQFTLQPGISYQKAFTVAAGPQGTGQRLYRFSMECVSKATTWCHTSGKPTTRSVLVAVDYGLSAQEQMLHDEFAVKLPQMQRRLEIVLGKQQALAAIAMAPGTVDVEGLNATLDGLAFLWQQGDYALLSSTLAQFESALTDAEAGVDLALNQTLLFVEEYEKTASLLTAQLSALRALQQLPILTSAQANETELLIAQINAQIKEFLATDRIATPLADISQVLALHGKAVDAYIAERAAKAFLANQALCNATSVCLSYPLFDDLAPLDSALCDVIPGFNVLLHPPLSNATLKEEIQGSIAAYQEMIKAQQLLFIPASSSLHPYFQPVSVSPVQELSTYAEDDILASMSAVPTCTFINASYPALLPFIAKNVSIPEIWPVPLFFTFAEPAPQCCLDGNCQPCCTDDACKSETYPVIFLHGHAANKDVSAEYSLDAFNKLQAALEDDGYLDAGIVTLYTRLDVPQYVWSPIPTSISLKVSYYQDLFKTPENYVVIQTKSENIDTYAIRLKELIDTVQYKTGRQKVRIVATSMGGLVSRRYLQIFGTSAVDKLILITVPNYGVRGSVVDYCHLIGEKLECRDMQRGSLFLNKLNRDPLPAIPVTNIIGLGCPMGEGDGDGIVLAEDARLPGAQEVVISGSCKGLFTLHTGILDTDIYPALYQAVKEALS